MKKYMLILFSYCGLVEINKHLKKKLKHKDELILRAIMLEGVPKLSKHLISDVGVLGKKVVSDVENSVVDIYRDNAENYLEEVKKMAAENNFQLDERLIEDHDLESLKNEIKTAELDRIFINFSHNKFVSDQVKEDEIKRWLEKIELPKDIFYDGKKKK